MSLRRKRGEERWHLKKKKHNRLTIIQISNVEFYAIVCTTVTTSIVAAIRRGSTIIAVLATDLLIGIGIGIGVKLLIHWFNGVSIRSLMFPYLAVEEDSAGAITIRAKESAVFSNWLAFRRQVT